MELGSGAGLVGVCLARATCSTIVLTDGNIQALENCTKNLAHNAIDFTYHSFKEDVSVTPGLVRTI